MPEGLDRLAEDWITLWQSEISAWAADRELAEAWSNWAALGAAWLRATSTPPPRAFQDRAFQARPFTPPGWAGFAEGQSAFDPTAFDPTAFGAPPAATSPPSPAGTPHEPAPTPRPAPAPPPPESGADARDGGSAEPGSPDRAALLARLAELERRLADLEGGPGGDAPDRPRPRRGRARS
ncbi:hypothetical protein NON00_14025 [Roseomonas sp. GC11]|uniref:hypothetical protein n=1 Tax=Roseomonas sp. GC11 TaxID=2950546 RepID=UPI002108E43B|nr:hypothetical protein [Roseomonas sp. GC11]MCQ4161039.1 hypothetical protein [Roseomonas sp. GC11]